MQSVVFIVPEMLPVPAEQGGAVEYLVDQVSQRLQRQGVSVSVISRPAVQSGPSGVRYLTVPWTRFERFLLARKQRADGTSLVRYLSKLANVLLYVIGVRKSLSRTEADVIYVHNDPLIALLVPKRKGQKLAVHMHNDHMTLRLLRPICALLLRRADLVLCVSDYITARAAGAFPMYKGKFRTLVNGTDPEFFRNFERGVMPVALERCIPSDGAFRFLFAGRLMPVKGAHILIEAFKQLRASHRQVSLVIVGSSFFAGAPASPYEADLAKRSAGHEDAILFTGYLERENLRFLYASADAVVVPSVWQEPSGLVVLEAMSSQTCVLAARVGGIPELIRDGETGLLFDPDDIDALHDAMRRVVEDDALRQRLSSTARRSVVEHFNFERMTKDTAAVLGALV